VKQDTQLVDGRNINDPVADINNIADMGGNQSRFAYSDRIADGKIRLLGLRGVRNKLVLTDAKILKLSDYAESGFEKIVDHIDFFTWGNADNLIQKGVVKGSGTDNLRNGVRDGDGKFGLDLGAGKKDALIGQKLGGIRDFRRGTGVKKDMVS
jgi:hypothetical protein